MGCAMLMPSGVEKSVVQVTCSPNQFSECLRHRSSNDDLLDVGFESLEEGVLESTLIPIQLRAHPLKLCHKLSDRPGLMESVELAGGSEAFIWVTKSVGELVTELLKSGDRKRGNPIIPRAEILFIGPEPIISSVLE